MIGTIARKEFSEMVRDGRFRWAAGIVFVLLTVSLASGMHHQRTVSAQHEAARAATRGQWLDQGEKNPHSAAHYGIYAFKPATPLSLVDRGVDSYVGVAAWLEAHRQNDFLYRPAQDGTAAQRFGELTASLVLQLFLPLLVITLAFGAFSAEREQGTLRQLLSLGVDRRALAAGKAGGLAAALALILVPAALVGGVALALVSGGIGLAASLPRAGALTLAYLAYLGVFIAITLGVSANARSSRVALVALLGFWIINSLVVPRAVTDVAKGLHPSPSAFTFEQRVSLDLANGLDGRSPPEVRAAELERATLARFGVSRIEDLPVNYSGISLQAGEDYAARVYQKNWSDVWGSYDQQNRFHQASAVIAPLLAIRSLSMALAGTDAAEHRRFALAAERYRNDLNRVMNDDIAANAVPGQSYLAGPELWARIPEFHYEAPSLATVLGSQRWSIAILLVWLAGASVVALRSAIRVRVD